MSADDVARPGVKKIGSREAAEQGIARIRGGMLTARDGDVPLEGYKGVRENAQEHRTPLGDSVTAMESEDGLFDYEAPPPVSLHDRFGMPPFSILDRRQGQWQDRKRKWLSLGIRSELGRDGGLIYDPETTGMGQAAVPIEQRNDRALQAMVENSAPGSAYRRKAQDVLDGRDVKRASNGAPIPGSGGGGAWFGKTASGDTAYMDGKWDSDAAIQRSAFRTAASAPGGGALAAPDGKTVHRSGGGFRPTASNGEEMLNGTSIFDPVLAELAYRWFTAPHMRILDPFAGGSVRGVVAGVLERHYMGIDLRAAQIFANKHQGADILKASKFMPRWVAGDSNEVLSRAPKESVDFLFTCHPAGTRITTARGIVPIESVTTSDTVWTHAGHWRPVTETFAFAYEGTMVEIDREHRIGLPLRCTADHLLLVDRDGDRGWRHAIDVREGDRLVEPVPEEPARPQDGEVVWEYAEPEYAGANNRRGRPRVGVTQVVATPDAARLLGYYIAEGSGRTSVSFAFGPDEDEYIADTLTLMRSVLDAHAVERPQNPDNRVRIVGGGGVRAAQFFDACGHGAGNKRFPGWVWQCSNAILAGVICGAWRGDGYFADKEAEYATVSEHLAEDMRRALLRFGIVASVKRRERRPNRYSKYPLALWCVTVRGASRDALAQIVDGESVAPVDRRRTRGAVIEGGNVLYRVTKVETYETVDVRDVYNLEVADDHSYMAEGVASHNCPPYADLEIYSDDPRDISGMPYEQFLEVHEAIIGKACAALKQDRFAAWVISDVRDKKTGCYRGLPGATVEAFKRAGLGFYNEQVVLDPVGSAAVRAGRIFLGGRKTTRMHQLMLVFCKGDWKRATEAISSQPQVLEVLESEAN